MKWLIDESKAIDAASRRELEGSGAVKLRAPQADLAIRLKEVVVHNNSKWFGGAEIRLDTLVVHDKHPKAKDSSFYKPTTRRFARVRDGDRLPIGETGLLVFYGQPRHFIDLSITVSRDRKDSKDLAELIAARAKSADFKASATSILALTSVSPQAGAIVGAVQAAAALGALSAELLLKATNDTIGLYRTSFLQHRDAFGLGQHPEEGSFTVNDLSFSYEIVIDKSERPRRRA